MRELVFGIIIESFKDLRIRETNNENDRLTKCFICGVCKDDLEKERINFKSHCDKDHNLWNYINYMLWLKFSDPQNLNAINSYVLEQIEKKYTNWIPRRHENNKDNMKNERMTNPTEDINVDLDKYNEQHHDLPINKN